ncbi:MBL fold metallo-hydrolase [Streptomyces sp. DSM 42041]|uniref:MBL fold metallo-hydrolase n=1 Tax=Streptomyces hazeniae TaxID=3075538 RepID=A0ABU2NKG7_9ACTN|nr:MBL fold metallo-hydrolase [Streptomyces sp. DSM 42041]MDT0377490.1 MBL fold metallo-hydrolase [Streptomyces sp. DSM 42041]
MDIGWEELAPGVLRARLPRWDATVGAVAGAEGALVVDTGSSLAEGAAVRTAVRERLGLPVARVALTHAHFDHVLGTAAFAGVQVYGAVGLERVLRHDREAIQRDAVRHGLDPAAAAQATDALVLPQHAVSGELTLSLGGGRQVLLANVGPGHTGHDLAVLVPGREPGAREVVFCGDLVEESGEPQAGPDALPARWPAALDRLLSLGGEDAVYVPGHGAVVEAAFVRAQRDALARRFARP